MVEVLSTPPNLPKGEEFEKRKRTYYYKKNVIIKNMSHLLPTKPTAWRDNAHAHAKTWQAKVFNDLFFLFK